MKYYVPYTRKFLWVVKIVPRPEIQIFAVFLFSLNRRDFTYAFIFTNVAMWVSFPYRILYELLTFAVVLYIFMNGERLAQMQK